jgi:ABC-type transport system involved in cytochrome bd biosynthesis fused ATPase/permease subunit
MIDSAYRMQTVISNDKILIQGTVAYVSQVSWVQNLSIRENITFGKEFNMEWYK